MKCVNENRIKHLEFVQIVITRMNTNSFQIKGWSITITVALLALYVNNGNEKFILIAIAPTILFWLLDTYYLQQERKFRGIYNDIAGLSKIEEKLIIKNFEMPIHKYRKGKYNYFKVMWSKTIWTFYFIQIILLIVGSIILSR